jgi:hypothetical protein
VIKKCIGLFQLLDLRQPSLGSHDSCKYYACAEIGHRQLNEPFSRERGAKVAGVSLSSFQEAFGQCCSVLKISFTMSLEDMCKSVNATQCLDTAVTIVDHFKMRVTAARTEDSRKNLHFDDTLLNCSALLLAGEVHRVSVDKMKLVEATSLALTRLDENIRAMRELTLKLLFPSGKVPDTTDEGEIIGGAPPKKKAKTVSKRAHSSSHAAPSSEPGLAGAEQPRMDFRPRITLETPLDKDLEEQIKKEDAIFIEKIMKVSMLCTPAQTLNSQSMADRRREEDDQYREWRENLTQKLAVEKRDLGPAKSLKQTTIAFGKATSSKTQEK